MSRGRKLEPRVKHSVKKDYFGDILQSPNSKMKRKNRVLGNFASLSSAKFVGDLITLILFAVISRSYGQEGFGQYSIAMAIGGFLAVCTDFGLTSLSITTLSRESDRFVQEFARFLLARAFLGLVAVTILFMLVMSFGGLHGFGLVLLLIGSSQIFFSFGLGFIAALMAKEKMHIAAGLELLLRIGTTGGVTVAVMSNAALPTALFVFPAANAIFAAASAATACAYYGIPPLHRQVGSVLRTLKRTVVYGISFFLEQLSSRIDVLVVAFFLGASSAGVYNAGYRVILALNFVPFFAARALLPVLSAQNQIQEPNRSVFFSRALGAAILVAVPAFIGVWLVAPQLIHLIFGAGFSDSTSVLRLLAVLLVINTFVHFFAMYLMSSDRQSFSTRMQWWAVIVAVVANISLVQWIGMAGAALATVLSQIVFLGLMGMRILRELDVRYLAMRLGIGCCGCMTMYAAFWYFSALNLVFLIPLAIATYILTIIGFRAVRDGELADILEMLGYLSTSRKA